MNPNECPAFYRCSAPLCPLDVDWRLRSIAPGESLCEAIREDAKEGADARFAERPAWVPIRVAGRALVASLKAERDASGPDGMRMGRGLVLRAAESAALAGSSWDAHKAAGVRLAASRKKP